MLEKIETPASLLGYINDLNLEESEKCQAIKEHVISYPDDFAVTDLAFIPRNYQSFMEDS